jgi:sn-glycerol 3-phosphate transport system permease protein
LAARDEGAMKPAKRHHPYLLMLPTVAVLVLFFIYPVVAAFYRSLWSWDLLTEPSFVGTENYRELASGDLFGVIWRTLRYSLVVVSASVSLGLALAVALNRRGSLYAFVRAAVFSAYIVSWVAVALLWLWILDGDAGVVSRTLRALSLPTAAWLTDPNVALYTLGAVTVWKITGYSMVIFLAGLQDVPPRVLEAAALDGAGPWRRFWHITFPLLRPTTAFVATTSLILSFQAFDIVRVMTQGGPVRSTTVFVYAIYEQIFLNLRVGRASALAVVFFVLLVPLTLLQLWAFRLSSGKRVAT